MSDDRVRYLRVRNWDTFQHYSDRRPTWIKLYVSLGTSPSFERLDDHQKVQLLSMWLMAAATDNQVPLDRRYLDRHNLSQTGMDLGALVDAGFIDLVEEDVNTGERRVLGTAALQDEENPANSTLAQGASPSPLDLTRTRNASYSDSSSQSKRNEKNTDVEAVYAYWRDKLGKTDARYGKGISPNRKRKILSRLAEFSVDELKLAIDGVLRDPWEDRPRHNDLTTVFRSQEQVEKFIALAEGERPKAGCPRCGVDCKTPSALTSHLANVHDVWGAAA